MISYKVNAKITVDQFIDILQRSTLGERRPLDDRECLDGMVQNGNLCVTAWENELLVGIARSVTDFVYACYLSDLAVDSEFQKLGIGKKLVELTRENLGPRCKIRLISAEAAMGYYPKIGFVKNDKCWELGPKGR